MKYHTKSKGNKKTLHADFHCQVVCDNSKLKDNFNFTNGVQQGLNNEAFLKNKIIFSSLSTALVQLSFQTSTSEC